MKNIEGMTLHVWLRTRISYPPEFYHYLNILENGEDINIDELRAILDGFEPTADLSDSVALLDDLRRALLELRAIPPPPSGQVSGAYGGPFISMRCSDRVVLQPFESIRAFHDMLLQSCGFRSRMPRLLKLAEPVYAKEHRLCFTHSDLHTRNILIKDGRLARILDWETAGWFPEYWEYTMLDIRVIQGYKPWRISWDAVGVFGSHYQEELELEHALCHSTGSMAVPPGVIPDDPLDQPLTDDESQ